MGLDDVDLLDDADGGGGTGKVSAAESCSICLETVIRNGDRSWAKLQCGHEFHLDCIGSAFNIKGAMQCPNCRKVEKGQWLYASGHRSLPEFSMDDWAHDEDLYDLSYSEMSFGVHWCPFSGLARLPSSFDEGDFSSACEISDSWLNSFSREKNDTFDHMTTVSTCPNCRLELFTSAAHATKLRVFPSLNLESCGMCSAYHDLIRQHALLAEHAAVSSATHQCPYIAYVGIHPSSSNSSGGVSDTPTFNNHWNGPSVPHEVPTYAFPGMDVHYHNWDHHSSPFPTTSTTRIGNADQPSIPSVPHRAARTTTDIPRQGSFVHPFLVSHSPADRAGSSVASSMIPPYPGSVARARDRVQALQAYFQQPSNSPGVRAPVVVGARRPSSHHRGMAQVSPMASSSDQPGGGFYFYPPPSSSSGRSFQEAENPQFHIWEQREHMPTSSLSQVDRGPVWGSSFHHGGGGSDPPSGGIRFNGFRQRHGSERMPSQHRS